MKKAWILALLLVLAGALLIVGVMTAVNFDLEELDTEVVGQKSTEPEGDFDSVRILDPLTDVRILFASDGKCRVEYPEMKNARVETEVVDGELIVKGIAENEIRLNVGFSFRDRITTIYLPEKEYERLTADMNSWNFSQESGLFFRDAEILTHSGELVYEGRVERLRTETGSGNMRLNGVTCEKLSASVQSGAMELYDVRAQGEIDLSLQSGSLKAEDVECEGLCHSGQSGSASFKRMKVTNDMKADNHSGTLILTDVVTGGEMNLTNASGGISLEDCDASNLYLETGSGVIAGTLLSGKTFLAESMSGSIRVPESRGEGICRVKTKSGTIRLSITQE